MIHFLKGFVVVVALEEINKEIRECLLGNKTQQCLPHQADERCQVQPGLGVKSSPEDSKKQTG